MSAPNWQISDDESKTLGQSLRLIKISNNFDPGFDEEYWIQGEEKYLNMFIGIQHGKACWIQATLRGYYAEFRNENWVTGETTDYTGSALSGPQTKLLYQDRQLNKDLLVSLSKIFKNSQLEITTHFERNLSTLLV